MQYFTDKELDRLAGKLGQKLMQEPKVRLMIAGSMEDMPWEGGINGYFFRIQRGVAVSVPQIRQNAQVQLLGEASVRPYKGNRGKRLSS